MPRDIEKEMDAISERLARIEQNQIHFSKQLDKVVALLDRMVKVEEHVDAHMREMERLNKEIKDLSIRVKENEIELSRWRTGRKIFIWFIAAAGSFVAIYSVFGGSR